MSELLLQASMGLSHIYHDIRVDACRLISLLLSIAPSHVVGHWPAPAHAGENRILDGLRLVAGIGGRAGEGGQNGLNLLPKSKLVILDTLLAFVKAGLRKQRLLKAAPVGGKDARASGMKDLQVPVEMFDPFQARYVTINRLTRSDAKGKGRELLPIARISDSAVEEIGQRFDGWLVQAWEAEAVLGDAGMWDLASVGRVDEDAGENVGQALSVSRYIPRRNNLELKPWLTGAIPPHAPAPNRNTHGIRTRRLLPLDAKQQPGGPLIRRRPPLTLSNNHGARFRPRRPGFVAAAERSLGRRGEKSDFGYHYEDVGLLSVWSVG